MAHLDFPEYLVGIRTESARFRAVLSGTDPATPVPTCPEWTAADLLWHLTEVQWFWSQIVATRPRGPEDLTAPSRPATYDDLLGFFDTCSAGLVTALENASPLDEAWTWSTEQTVGFTFRRQAHEALIHRLDAELTAGAVTPLDPALSGDGVDEVLSVMFGGCPPWGSFTPSGAHVLVEMVDTGAAVNVALGRLTGTDPADGRSYDEDDISVVDTIPHPPDATLSGSAEDLDAWLWRRRDDTGLRVAGDRTAYDRFHAVIDHPIG